MKIISILKSHNENVINQGFPVSSTSFQGKYNKLAKKILSTEDYNLKKIQISLDEVLNLYGKMGFDSLSKKGSHIILYSPLGEQQLLVRPHGGSTKKMKTCYVYELKKCLKKYPVD